jgi:RNA polymerase sigma-70 factor (ECF subfamily)
MVEKIYKYLYFKVEQEAAFDLTETVFLKVWENIKKYQQKSGATFVSWVFRIAHNLLVDHYRFNKENLELDLNVADHKIENNPIYLTEQSLSRLSLKNAFSQLKDDSREVLTLSFINGLDNSEVASLMKKSEGGLRVLKFRALQELKKILLDMGIKY